MKKIIIYLTVFAFLFASSCTDELTDLNVDTKNPEIVPYTSLFTNANVALFKRLASPNVNRNTFRLWAQHWMETTYPDESNYQIDNRNANGRWFNEMYSTVLRDLAEAKVLVGDDEFLTDEEKNNTLAIMEILNVYAYTTLVDIFGDVPYTAALGEDITPAYDVDQDIYNSLVDRLSAAIGKLSGSTGLGSSDLVYGGDAASWRKFGNSLKLRMAIRLADVNSSKAGIMAKEATDDGVFDSSADDFQLTFSSSTPNTNPLWEDLVQSGRADFVAAETLADLMNPLNDPRREQFFSALDSVGNVIGAPTGAVNTYSLYSHPGDKLLDPTWPGTIMSYTEVHFLLADAVERGYDVGGSAAGHYEAGVKNSVMQWGGSQQEADDYYAQADVDYATAPGTFKQKIGLQRYIALYDQGLEAYTSYRMYDWPEMNIAVDAGTTPPNRWNYPSSEFSINMVSVNAAVSSKGSGVDDVWTKIFWDVN